MCFFSKSNKDKKRVEELKKKFGDLQIEYEEKMDKYACSLCEKFKSGAVRQYSERFAACSECEHCEEMKKLASDLDNMELEITALQK